MTNEEVRSLRKVLDYLKEEEAHFKDCSSKEKRNHIFTDVLVLRDFEKRVNRYNNRLATRNSELLLLLEAARERVQFSAECAVEDMQLQDYELLGKIDVFLNEKKQEGQ
ncbi:MAG: hypothetical protein HY865_22270 [Chloroflexi bacterium]|nr:hypothetical protein [Chloroflexota bacterium]